MLLRRGGLFADVSGEQWNASMVCSAWGFGRDAFVQKDPGRAFRKICVPGAKKAPAGVKTAVSYCERPFSLLYGENTVQSGGKLRENEKKLWKNEEFCQKQVDGIGQDA